MTALRARLADQRGFTLVEMLVVMLIGIVVFSAAMSITENGARSSARVVDRVDVTQRARLAMERLTRVLRTQSCLDENPPIVSGSGTAVTFYADAEAAAVYQPRKTVIAWESTGNGQGQITQKSYTSTSTASPWVFPTNPTREATIMRNVAPIGASTDPIFKFYGEGGVGPLAVPLNQTFPADPPANSVARVAQIEVGFQTRPQSGSADSSKSVALKASVYARNNDPTDVSSTNRNWAVRCG